jgi:hypothetical protein
MRALAILSLCSMVQGAWAAAPVHMARHAAVNTGTDNDFFNTVAYGNGLYAAAGTDGVLYSSTDGSHWTAEQGGIGLGGQYLDMIYANGTFLAIGIDGQRNTHATRSVDGVTWKDALVPLPVSTLFQGVGFGNGSFVVTDTVAATSTDGVNWTINNILAGNTSDQFGAPVFANSTFVTLGFDISNNPLLYVSKDNGATWSSGFSFASTDDPQIVVSNGSSFVLLGQDNACQCGLVITSPDGVTWTRQSNASADVGQYFDASCSDSQSFFSAPVIWDGSRFVTYTYTCISNTSAGLSAFSAYISSDGVNWTAGATHSVAAGQPDNNAFFSYHPVVAVPSGYLATSDDALALDSSPDFANWAVAANLAPPPAPASSGGGGMPGWPVLGVLACLTLLRRYR